MIDLAEFDNLFNGAPAPVAKDIKVPTTDEIDHITAEQRAERVAFCEHCEAWWHFVANMDPTPEEAVCPKCEGKPSLRHGFQVTSKRTFDATAAKKKKFKKR